MQTLEQNNALNQGNSFLQDCYCMRSTEISAAHRIISTLLAEYHGPIAIQLWDGSLFRNSEETQCVLHIHHPHVLRDLILHRDLVRLAESYIAGQIEVSGNFESLFLLEEHLKTFHPSLQQCIRLFFDALKLPSLKTQDYHKPLKAGNRKQSNSRNTIAHHYDVGNDFYRLWLDKNMVYSCAYFRTNKQSLDEAQADKLDYLCRKLRLKPGQKLLDIGCGWGALAIWAATHYGVTAHGITLSKEQQAFAMEQVKKNGLDERVTIELRDYRNLPEKIKYDRIVSVGMFEHIGVKNFPQYFGKVKTLLKPGGLFLNHGITSKDGWRDTPMTRFMNQYIFPDGELARISEVNNAMENAGFEIVDVESLRRHYALTLRCWVKALESNKQEATDFTNIETYRLWRLYMAACAYYFDEGSINVYQVLAGHQHNTLPAPLRREDLYIQ
ncbi:MAG TPA: class I SAM-dependent methyltransferase [Chromatiales bacterium]|nr:class I SAM-dependent methyltransferase [Thiotrichales bacterium]HIP69024.1 class I SAM-dependent methyltransferase [Chromatiales bacterium]